jgi:hypothetical protein
MLRILEIVIGIALIYISLDRLTVSERLMSVLYGVVAVAGLILAVHGILLFTVPEFFKPSI